MAGATATVVGFGGAVATATADRPPREARPVADLDGATLFQLKGCARCHDGPGSTADIGVGPPLLDAAAWAGTRRPGLDAAAYLTESMRAPGAYVASGGGGGPFGMPSLVLTDDEIDRLVAYLLDG